ncbi:uncharacterized protein [Mytilus edulis]|uniref:uncharacterized protein n=1 Tax=Mytilus edulis TaxID=6550 RepID=UPI0039F12B46
MALSRSLEKGQTLVLCQFCENDSKITNKCLDCKLLLCAKCSNKLHAMVKGAGDHTIVNIRSLRPHHSVEIKDFRSIKCKQHPTQTACLFCSTCEQSACPACVTKVHKKHNIVDFQDVYQLKVERLHCGQGKVENNYKEIARRDNNLDHIKTEENSRLSNIRESIRDRALLIKSEVDECACRLISEVDVENAKFDRTIQNEHSTLDGIKTHLNGQRQKVQDMKESNDMVQFFAKIVDVTKSIEDCLPPTYSITRELQFLPGLAFHPSVVGEILHENENCEYKPKLEITRKYVSEYDVIQFLISGPDNSLWYSININKKVLEKVTLAEEQLESLSSKEIMVYGLAFVPGYGLLLSTDHETLKIIPENSDEIQDSRFAVDSLEPKCIHVTKDNKLAIGAISKGPLYPASGQRVVILMDMEGNKLSTFEFNQKGERLFTNPWGIASTTNGNVFILDRTDSNCDGRLVILKRDDGSVIDIYNGREGKNFVPRGILATEADNIIITDTDDPEISLHILDNCGKLISYYNTRDIGIECPFSMTFSANGHLYIGGTTSEGSGNKAELFEIDLFEI